MAKNFRTLRKALGPTWLTSEGDSLLVGYSLDLMRDAFVERLRLGLMARFPQQDKAGTPAPSDAIAAMGRDRRVVRGLNESDASYITRLLAWLDDRKTSGNAFTLMQRLSEYLGAGCVFRTVDNSGNWYTRAVDGTRTLLINQANWDWDHNSAKWSRFWVVIYPPSSLWVPENTWGTGTWGDGGTWGTTATVDEVTTVRSLIADWKPAGTRCVNIIVAFDPASFDPTSAVDSTGMPDGLWGHWSKNVAGVQVPARLSTARYFDGTS